MLLLRVVALPAHPRPGGPVRELAVLGAVPDAALGGVAGGLGVAERAIGDLLLATDAGLAAVHSLLSNVPTSLSGS